MISRRIFFRALLTLAAIPLMFSGQTGCATGDAKKASGATSKFKASNAKIVSSEGGKMKIRIKCSWCGFRTAEIEIEEPTSEKPYRQGWTCPRCGHRQQVTVEVA